MQSFYGNVSKPPVPTGNGTNGTNGTNGSNYSSGGSRSSSCTLNKGLQKSFYNESLWTKAPSGPPPIFASPKPRSDEALQLDRRLRSVETVSALMAVVTVEALPRFDAGNLVVALGSGARLADERTVVTLRFGYPAWNLLLSRVQDCIQSLEPRGLAMVAHSAAKLGIKDMALWSQLTRCSSAKSEALSSTDVAKLCWAVSKLDLVTEFLDFWKTMEAAVIRQASTAQSVDLSMTCWALGTAAGPAGAGGTVPAALSAALAENALRLVEELTPQCLANICWAMARLGCRGLGGEPLRARLLQRARRVLPSFVEFDVTHFCWALAKLDEVDPELFEDLAEHAVRGGFVRRCTSQMATELLWAFASSDVWHEVLLEQLALFVVRHVNVLEASQLASCCWSLASANFSPPSLLEAFGNLCKSGRLGSFRASEFSAFVWGLAKMGLDDCEVVPVLLQLAVGMVEDLDDAGLVNLLASLVTLTCSDARGVQHMDPQGHLQHILDSAYQHFARASAPQGVGKTAPPAALLRCFCRAGRLDEALKLARIEEVPELRLLAVLLSCAEADGNAAALWGAVARRAELEQLQGLRMACQFASGEQLPRLIEDLTSSECNGSGALVELNQLLLELVTGSRTLEAALEWMEDFGGRCEDLELCLGTRATVFDEFTSRLPQLVLAPGGADLLCSVQLAAKLQDHGGHLLVVHQDPLYVAAARCVAELLGLSSAAQFLLGEAEDVLPRLLERHGRSAVDVLLLRGGNEERYLSDLKVVEELGLFTSGCILADHMLRYGSPRFLQEMRRRHHKLELVEVVDVRGLDWMALSSVQAPLDPVTSVSSVTGATSAPVAALTARVRLAWREGAGSEDLKQRMLRHVAELHLSPSRRFVAAQPARPRRRPETETEAAEASASSRQLPAAMLDAGDGAAAAEGKSPRVAQEYLRTLDFKRWLTAVDPSGGCLEYLQGAMQLHHTVEQLLDCCKAGGLEIVLEALRVSCPQHRQRFQRFFEEGKETREASSPAEPPALPVSATPVQEDTAIDLKHLSFSDWLASIDAALPLASLYLPRIEQSYDTVSQIVSTYTILGKDGSEKTLDPQIFEDFAVAPEHQAAFASWFVRFCGVQPDSPGGDPSTPHFGEDDLRAAEASSVAATEEPPKDPAVTKGINFDELADAEKNVVEPGAFEEPVSTAGEVETTGERTSSVHSEGMENQDKNPKEEQQEEQASEAAEAQRTSEAPKSGGGFFDFDDLDEAEMG